MVQIHLEPGECVSFSLYIWLVECCESGIGDTFGISIVSFRHFILRIYVVTPSIKDGLSDQVNHRLGN